MKSYDYKRRTGAVRISWDRFARMTGRLVEKLSDQNIDAVVGIARAGLFPSTAIACALRRELYPIRLTRRLNDQVTYEHPRWKADVSGDVKDKTIAIVDEIADTGETLFLAAERVREFGAKRVVTAALVSHTWSEPMPDAVALVSDELIIFPWDEQIYKDGRWQFRPELTEALRLQGLGHGELTDG